MASNNHKEEPSTAPKPDVWYDLNLGSSLKDVHSSSKFCTLRYEFKPASIDKNQPGALHKSKDNRVTVEFNNNQQGKPKVVFEGSSEDYKENDAVLFFDGESFRLERLHRAVKRLRHVRVPGESSGPAPIAGASSAGPSVEISSPPLAKAQKFQSGGRSLVSSVPAVPVEVERIEIGDFKSSDEKPRKEKVPENPYVRVTSPNESPDIQIDDDLEEQLDILNDDDDDGIAAPSGGNIDVKEFDTGIDINIPQNDTDDEIADVDVSDDDEADKGRNAAEALRAQVNAQVNAQEKEDHSSSSSSTTGSTSSGSGSGSSSSDSDSSDGDSVNSI